MCPGGEVALVATDFNLPMETVACLDARFHSANKTEKASRHNPLDTLGSWSLSSRCGCGASWNPLALFVFEPHVLHLWACERVMCSTLADSYHRGF